jgi:hypothetical protein
MVQAHPEEEAYNKADARKISYVTLCWDRFCEVMDLLMEFREGR